MLSGQDISFTENRERERKREGERERAREREREREIDHQMFTTVRCQVVSTSWSASKRVNKL